MKTWNYLINTFEVTTKGSFRQAKKIGDYTLLALKANSADPVIAQLSADLTPTVDAYAAAYAEWIKQMGSQKSHTNDLTVQLKVLSAEKIKVWDIAIQQQFLEGTKDFIALLPNHRKPFQVGSQEDKLAACKALSLALAPYPSLKDTKTDVDAFIDILQAAFDTQKGSLSVTGNNSDALEAARQTMCVELYGVLGGLMVHYKTKPVDAEKYFDLESIRNHEQVLFKGSLHAAETKLALTHTFIAGEDIQLQNTGNTPLRFALCATATDAIGTVFVEIPAQDQRVVDVAELGDINNRFLKVQNTDAKLGAKYSFMLL